MAFAVTFFVAAGTVVSPPAMAQSIGDLHFFAHVPYPGNPGGLAVDGSTLWVDTSAASSDRPFDGSSSLFAYDLGTGKLTARRPNPILVPKPPVAVMGLAGIALDSSGRQYIADMNGQVVRVDSSTGQTQVYATIPTSTSTSYSDMPTVDAFGPDGSLYVGDAEAPVIWRVPPGGGQARPWFLDPRLSGSYGGNVMGLALDPTGKYLYFAAGTQETNVTIYRLPLAGPSAANLEEVHAYKDLVVPPCAPNASNPNAGFVAAQCALLPTTTGAGAIAFGHSGRLYVALLAKNQLSILGPNGTERARFPSTADNQKLDVPLDGPFGLAFDGKGSLLVSSIGEPTLGYGPGGPGGLLQPPGGLPDSKSWAILSAWVNDTAAPLFRPTVSESAQTAQRLAASAHFRRRATLECFLMAHP